MTLASTISGRLPPSHFKVEVSRDGFKTKVLDNVAVIAEQQNALNVELEVGTTTETITVNAAEAPLIDTETAQISGTITGKEIQNLPVFGRDVFQVVQLAPGFFGDGARNGGGGTNALPGNAGPGGSGASTGVYATENRSQVSAAGGRTDGNGVSLDGVSVNSVSWNGAAIVTPNPDSVKLTKATQQRLRRRVRPQQRRQDSGRDAERHQSVPRFRFLQNGSART